MLAPAVVAPSSDTSPHPSSSSTMPTCSGSTSNSPGCMDHIDLKVTKEELNVLEWSLRRSEVPDVLARRGITLDEWKTVLDKCDRLYRKRSRALLEINEERDRHCLRNPNLGPLIAYVGQTLFVGSLMFGMFMEAMILFFGLAIVFNLTLVMTDNTVHFPKYFDAMAAYEKDWSQLADEQRRVFQSHADVNVEQLQEVVVVHGRKPTWTVGLRFRFEIPTNGQNWTETAGDDGAVHDLERLLELSQYGVSGNVQQEEEYQRLKTRLSRKLAQHSNAPNGPPVVTAMAMVVTDDENSNHHEEYDEKKHLLEMV